MMGIVGVLSTIVLVIVAGYAGTKWLVKTDAKIEDRRRAASKLAGQLRGVGLLKTPEFLEDYAVGDYSGMGAKLVELVKLFGSGEIAVLTEFEQVFERCLVAKLATEQGRAFLATKLQDAPV